MTKELTKNVPLTTEELKFAKLRLDEAEIQDMMLKAQQKISEREIELGLPQRKATEQLESVSENLKRNKMNKDFYAKQIREGKVVSVEKNVDKKVK